MTDGLDIENVDALTGYLRERGAIPGDESPGLQTLRGGVSNRTVRVDLCNGSSWVLKQALSKLRVEVDWFSDPRRVHREAAGIRWLSSTLPEGAVPGLVFEDHERHIIAMEAVPLPHEIWKTVLLRGDVDGDAVRQLAVILATMHGESCRRRDAVPGELEDRSYFESLRLEPCYGFAAAKLPRARSFLTGVIEETRARRESVVHGDFSPKNVLVHGGRLVLIDHEVIHVGDPSFDLGFSLTHMLSKAHHVDGRRQAFNAAARLYWETYRESLGDVDFAADLETRVVRQTLACLLARVAGRSPLEYLDDAERECQQEAILSLMPCPPRTVPGLISAFVAALPGDG